MKISPSPSYEAVAGPSNKIKTGPSSKISSIHTPKHTTSAHRFMAKQTEHTSIINKSPFDMLSKEHKVLLEKRLIHLEPLGPQLLQKFYELKGISPPYPAYLGLLCLAFLRICCLFQPQELTPARIEDIALLFRWSCVDRPDNVEQARLLFYALEAVENNLLEHLERFGDCFRNVDVTYEASYYIQFFKLQSKNAQQQWTYFKEATAKGLLETLPQKIAALKMLSVKIHPTEVDELLQKIPDFKERKYFDTYFSYLEHEEVDIHYYLKFNKFLHNLQQDNICKLLEMLGELSDKQTEFFIRRYLVYNPNTPYFHQLLELTLLHANLLSTPRLKDVRTRLLSPIPDLIEENHIFAFISQLQRDIKQHPDIASLTSLSRYFQMCERIDRTILIEHLDKSALLYLSIPEDSFREILEILAAFTSNTQRYALTHGPQVFQSIKTLQQSFFISKQLLLFTYLCQMNSIVFDNDARRCLIRQYTKDTEADVAQLIKLLPSKNLNGSVLSLLFDFIYRCDQGIHIRAIKEQLSNLHSRDRVGYITTLNELFKELVSHEKKLILLQMLEWFPPNNRLKIGKQIITLMHDHLDGLFEKLFELNPENKQEGMSYLNSLFDSAKKQNDYGYNIALDTIKTNPFHLKVQEPLFIKAFETIEKLEPRINEKGMNFIKIHLANLRNRAQSILGPDETSQECLFVDNEVKYYTINLATLRSKAAIRQLHASDLPKDISRFSLDTLFFDFTLRYHLLTDREQATIDSYIAQLYGEFDFEKCQKNINESELITLFKEREAHEPIPIHAYYLYHLLDWISKLSNHLEPGKIVTEREEAFISFCLSLQYCETGQHEALYHFFQSTGIPLPNNSTIGSEKVDLFLDQEIQKVLNEIFNSPEIIYHFVQREVDHESHHSLFLKNRYGHLFGLDHELTYDQYTFTIDSRLLKTSKEKILLKLYHHFKPKVVLKRLKAAFEREFAKNIAHLQDPHKPSGAVSYMDVQDALGTTFTQNHIKYDESFNPVGLTRRGAIALLLKTRYFNQCPPRAQKRAREEDYDAIIDTETGEPKKARLKLMGYETCF